MKKILIILLLMICITGCSNDGKKYNADSDKIKELLIKDYYFSEMLYYSADTLSDKKISDFTITYNDNIYIEAVKSKYQSLDELYSLVNKVFIKDSYDHYSRIINIDDIYIEVGSSIYVKEKKEYCDIGSNYDFDSFEIIDETDSEITIKFNEKEYEIYIVDGEYKLKYNIFECLN